MVTIGVKKARAKNAKKFVKNGEEFFPWYSASLMFRVFSKFSVFSALGVIFTYIGNLIFVRFGANFVVVAWEYIKRLWATIKYMLATFEPPPMDTLSQLFDSDRIDGIAVEKTATYREFSESIDITKIVTIIGVIAIAVSAFYILTLVLRRTNKEYNVRENDKLARQLKKEALNILGVKPGDNYEIDQNGERKPRWKSREERQAVNAIRNMNVAIHTRVELNGSKVYQRATIRIREPKQLAVRKDLLTKLDEAQEVFTAASNGLLTFGEMQASAKRDFMIWRAENDVTEEVAEEVNNSLVTKISKRSKERQETKRSSETEWTVPLDLLVDRTALIDDARAKAQRFAEDMEKTLTTYFDSTGNPATLRSIDVGNSSVSFRYDMAKLNFSLTQIEEELARFTNQNRIQVSAQAGDIIVNVPLADGDKVPIDVTTMVREIWNV